MTLKQALKVVACFTNLNAKVLISFIKKIEAFSFSINFMIDLEKVRIVRYSLYLFLIVFITHVFSDVEIIDIFFILCLKLEIKLI